jgi:hypothetical protein
MPFKNREKQKEWRRQRYAANPEKYREEVRAWKANRTPEQKRRSNRRATLRGSGWTLEAFEAAEQAQGGRCAICQDKPASGPGNAYGSLSGDHVHEDPPRPRGLLCQSCNAGLGLFKDSPERLQAAIDYLLFWQRTQGVLLQRPPG